MDTPQLLFNLIGVAAAASVLSFIVVFVKRLSRLSKEKPIKIEYGHKKYNLSSKADNSDVRKVLKTFHLVEDSVVS